jgi:hypothetical protein
VHYNISTFCSELFLSQCASVDTFLEHRPELVRVGKLAIALSLLRCENESNLFSFDVRTKGFYHYLYNKLNTGWDKFNANRLAIITFNYDRSLEHFLFSALKHTYNRPDDEIAGIIASIPIVHVHGWLGPLPWQQAGGRPYQGLFEGRPPQEIKTDDKYRMELARTIQRASEEIIIVSEANHSTEQFITAANLIVAATRTYFLGFGYHPVNLDRLKLSEIPLINRVDHNLTNLFQGPNMIIRPIRGTALGLGEGERSDIQKRWKIWLPDNHHDSLSFLKEYADLS